MYANSPRIESAQGAPHRRLLEVVDKHRRSRWRQPIAEHSRIAFEQLRAWLSSRDSRPLLLDSGCGTGASTLKLAHACPHANVVGIDQSLDRLSRHAELRDDLARIADHAVLVRGRLEDLWRLLLGEGIHVHRHCLWYPNPWPKPVHLQRRWHAHPVWPALLELGGVIELRSNWRVYVDEFALALAACGWISTIAPVADDGDPMTPFERKYRDSGHPLWCLSATVAPGNAVA